MSPSGHHNVGEHELLDELLVAPAVVLHQNATELAQEAVHLEGAGEVWYLNSRNYSMYWAWSTSFLTLCLGHPRRFPVLRRGDVVTLHHVAVSANEAIDRVVGYFSLLADLDGELEQLHALGVAAGGIV